MKDEFEIIGFPEPILIPTSCGEIKRNASGLKTVNGPVLVQKI
ncbi:MAG TPA: hypothetical protein PLM56_12410 [Cyclobacteriaceae bacterium]|jgi:hypothetical protein|nr:hypothetical protein [Cyclobacteriaceae bacterium]HRF34297.1 hypothetical protein [Cyclobacteriaceae bacterium]